MKGSENTIGLRFWLLWVLGTVASASLAGAIASYHVESVTFGSPWHWMLTGGLLGGATGTTQWLLLRRTLQVSKWPWVTLAGLAAGLGLGNLLMNAIGHKARIDIGVPIIALAWGPVAGASVGLLQWLLLRRQAPRSAWWIWASVVGWAMALVIGILIGNVVFWSYLFKISFLDQAAYAAGAAVAGAISGAVMASVLVWLLRRGARQSEASRL